MISVFRSQHKISYLFLYISILVVTSPQISSGEAIFRLSHELDKMEAANSVKERDEINERVKKDMESKQKVLSSFLFFLHCVICFVGHTSGSS